MFSAGASVIAGLYLLGTLARAKQKLFWHDEIFTVILSRLEPGELWQALGNGVDLNPPGFYVATRISQTVFGSGLIGTRMPAVLGVLLASLCVAVFVRRRHGPFAGLVAALLLLGSDAYLYAYEARPYGLVLGFIGVALVCWQSTRRSRSRGFWIAGLSLSLAAAVACHYYAVLVLVPLAAGELYRVVRRRKMDSTVWVAAACATVPLLACWPLIVAAREYSPRFFAPPSLGSVLESFESTLSALVVPAIATLILVGGAFVFGRSARPAYTSTTTEEQDEWVVAAVLTMLPLLAYVTAVVWTHALVPRHYLPWTLGFSILVPMTIAQWHPGRHRLFVVLTCVLLGWFALRQFSSARWLTRAGPDPGAMYPSLMAESGTDMPIVFGHSHVFLAAVYYASPTLAPQLVTLSWPDAPARYDTSVRAFRKLQRTTRLRLEDFDAFTARHRRFLFYGPTPDALLEKIRRSGAEIVLRAEDEDMQQFAMSRPGPSRLFDVNFRP